MGSFGVYGRMSNFRADLGCREGPKQNLGRGLGSILDSGFISGLFAPFVGYQRPVFPFCRIMSS